MSRDPWSDLHMDFKISGRHVEVTPAMQDFARSKTQKLQRYYDRIQEISVIVNQADHAFHVEIIVTIDHHERVLASQRGDDVYACIDQIVDKLERQLTDVKERLRNHKHVH
jgi:putative sigma-54 modulation protein